jgi:hypothetical protein
MEGKSMNLRPAPMIMWMADSKATGGSNGIEMLLNLDVTASDSQASFRTTLEPYSSDTSLS